MVVDMRYTTVFSVFGLNLPSGSLVSWSLRMDENTLDPQHMRQMLSTP